MKKLSFLVVIAAGLLLWACSDKKSERFTLLTTPVWAADSLLSDGIDASGPGQLLEKFDGDARFNEDGTGTFGDYKGKWMFSDDEKVVTIMSDSLPMAIYANIVMLTTKDLKITTSVPNSTFTDLFDIRMTFKAK